MTTVAREAKETSRASMFGRCGRETTSWGEEGKRGPSDSRTTTRTRSGRSQTKSASGRDSVWSMYLMLLMGEALQRDGFDVDEQSRRWRPVGLSDDSACLREITRMYETMSKDQTTAWYHSRETLHMPQLDSFSTCDEEHQFAPFAKLCNSNDSPLQPDSKPMKNTSVQTFQSRVCLFLRFVLEHAFAAARRKRPQSARD